MSFLSNLIRHKSSRKNTGFSSVPAKGASKAASPISNLTPFSASPTRRPGTLLPFIPTPQPLKPLPANPPTVANPFANPSVASDAPPSYTAVDPVIDDPLAFLSEFDTTFVIDDSGSMQISKPENMPTRWAQVSRALADIAPTCTKYDEDGVDVYFLNNPDKDRYKNIKRAETIHEIFNQFEPAGKTPTGKKLKAILDPYLEKCKTAHARGCAWPKPLNVIVITDGAPTDDLESVLVDIAQRLDKIEALSWQVGVQFCQVGDDKDAIEMLQFLDDDLAKTYECRDFVDTQRYDAKAGRTEISKDLIMKTVLGAVNKRWDRKRLSIDGSARR